MNIIHKLTSRKFITAAVGMAAGLCMVFGVDGQVVSTVSGAVMAAASAVSYILAEGRLDALSICAAAEKLQSAIDAVKNDA